MANTQSKRERWLSEPQERALLQKHLSGDFGRVCWPTVRSLLDAGMVAEAGKNIVVTADGRAYCDEYHAVMPFTTTAS